MHLRWLADARTEAADDEPGVDDRLGFAAERFVLQGGRL